MRTCHDAWHTLLLQRNDQSVAGLVGDVTTFDVSVQDMVQDMSHVVRSCLLNGEWSGVEPPIAGRTTTASASPPLGAWLSRQLKHGSGSGNHCRAMRHAARRDP